MKPIADQLNSAFNKCNRCKDGRILIPFTAINLEAILANAADTAYPKTTPSGTKRSDARRWIAATTRRIATIRPRFIIRFYSMIGKSWSCNPDSAGNFRVRRLTASMKVFSKKPK
jgi:hypothetical protein